MYDRAKTAEQQQTKTNTKIQQSKNLTGYLLSMQGTQPTDIVDKGMINPEVMTYDELMQLQQSIGNKAVAQYLNSIGQINDNSKLLQREPENKNEILTEPVQMKKNHTGLPDNLKAGVEKLSGLSMDRVKVNYNSSKPAEVGALAYTQGTDIYMAPGQERHLAHEAWHVIQQVLGRVSPIFQMKNVSVNDNAVLETEADMMGRKAEQIGTLEQKKEVVADGINTQGNKPTIHSNKNSVIQRVKEDGTDTEGSDTEDEKKYQKSKKRKKFARKLIKKEKKLLNVASTTNRLERFSKSESEERKKIMFKKGVRPKKSQKPQLYRKESKFLQTTVKVGDISKLPSPGKQEQDDIKTLNTSLSQGFSIEEAEKQVESKFLIPQFRGLFYTKSGFTKKSRKSYRKIDEKDRPVFSSAALDSGPWGKEKYYSRYNDPEQKEELDEYQDELETEGEKIIKKIHKLKEKPVSKKAKKSVPNSTERLQSQNMSDLSTHLYSQNYDKYMGEFQNFLDRKKSGKKKSKPLDPMFEPFSDLELAKSSNPKVSTGDTPVHASKYAFGLKPYKGKEGDILDPEYNEKGKPKHPYSGKIYTSIHPLTDYDENGPTQVVSLQNQHRINLSQMIVQEHESQFDWMIKKDRVKIQHLAKFPDLSKKYKEVFAEKYGLTKELFETFQEAISSAKDDDERVYIESLLSNHLAKHSDVRMLKEAQDYAKEKGAKLVYRTGEQSFGFDPLQIEKSTPKPQKKKIKRKRKKKQAPEDQDTFIPKPKKQSKKRKRKVEELAEYQPPSQKLKMEKTTPKPKKKNKKKAISGQKKLEKYY